MSDDQEAYRFVCGGDMDPTVVRAAYPGARFVARARLVEDPGGSVPWLVPLVANEDEAEVWGILLRDADAASGARWTVVTDEGRSYAARVATTDATAGTPSDILAAARYWELPPAYVRRLRAAVEAAGVQTDDDA